MPKIAYTSGAKQALLKLGFSPLGDIALPAAGGALVGAAHGALEDLPEGVDRLDQIRGRALKDALTTPLYLGAARGGAHLGGKLSKALNASYTTEPILEGLGGIGAIGGTAAASHLSGADDKLDDLLGVYDPRPQG